MTFDVINNFLPWFVSGATIVVVFVSVLIALKASQMRRKAEAERKRVARDLIISYLKEKDFTMVSYERIRKNIDPTYSDEFLASLPASFPSELRRATLRDERGVLGKPGLARITKGVASAENDTEVKLVDLPLNSLQRIRDMTSLDQIRSALDQIIRQAATD